MKTHLFVAMCLALIASAPLTYPGPLQTHVGFAPLYALLEQRFASAELGTLPAWLAALLTRIGLSPLTTLKMLAALAFGLGAIGMFLLARKLYDDVAGLIASALYSMLPYRLMTTYVRGATGEAWFWGLLPFCVWLTIIFTTKIPRHDPLKGASDSKKKILATFVPWCLGGLFLVALWLLCVPRTDEPPQLVYLFQLFSASWNYGSHGDWLDAIPLQLGLAPLGLSLIALWLRPERRAFSSAASAALCALLSIAPFSAWWPWAWLLDAPWQLIGLVGFLLCLLGGSVAVDSGDFGRPETEATKVATTAALPILAVMLTFTVLASYSYLTPRGLDYDPTTPPLARFGHEAYLVSATITPTFSSNTTFTVTLLWQSLRPFTDDYKVFVHIIDAQEKILMQRDAIPLNGARPTRSWQRGELLRETYTFTLSPDAPRDVRLVIGLYRSANGVRLKTSDGADKIVIGN
jgi:hypothetical protein